MRVPHIWRPANGWAALLIGRKRPGIPFLIGLIDIALVAVTLLMAITNQTVLFFHIIFVLLSIGAFFWPFRSFVIRSICWVSVATIAVLSAVYVGTTQVDELIEIPLLTIILLTVFAIAQYRSKAQDQAIALNEQLAHRLAELDQLNNVLRQEADTRARLEEEAVRSHEHYIQMVIHDLKNPLSAIQGYHELLLELSPINDEQIEIVERAKRSSTYMLDLVTDILDVARLKEGGLNVRRTPTDMGRLMQDCIAELRPLFDQHAQQVSLTLAPSVPLLAVDAGLLRRVITNLLSNAIKHTEPGTKIHVVVQPEGSGGVNLLVEDNGPGIPLEQQPFLFERFSTMARNSTKRNSTGLGLAFCKLAIEAHDGTIAVKSMPGAGTTFIIGLPNAPHVATFPAFASASAYS